MCPYFITQEDSRFHELCIKFLFPLVFPCGGDGGGGRNTPWTSQSTHIHSHTQTGGSLESLITMSLGHGRKLVQTWGEHASQATFQNRINPMAFLLSPLSPLKVIWFLFLKGKVSKPETVKSDILVFLLLLFIWGPKNWQKWLTDEPSGHLCTDWIQTTTHVLGFSGFTYFMFKGRKVLTHQIVFKITGPHTALENHMDRDSWTKNVPRFYPQTLIIHILSGLNNSRDCKTQWWWLFMRIIPAKYDHPAFFMVPRAVWDLLCWINFREEGDSSSCWSSHLVTFRFHSQWRTQSRWFNWCLIKKGKIENNKLTTKKDNELNVIGQDIRLQVLWSWLDR